LIVLTIFILIPVQNEIDKRILEIKKQTINIIEDKLSRKIGYSSISPSLFMYMEFRDFVIFDQDSELININRIRIYYNLKELIFGTALRSLKEIRIVKSNFSLDYAKDYDLLEFIREYTANNTATEEYPEMKITGKNININLIKDDNSIKLSKFFFSLSNTREEIQFTSRGSVKTSINQLNYITGSALFNISGTINTDLTTANSLFVLKSIDNSYLKVNKISFYASYEDSIVELRKVEDSKPIDLKIEYALDLNKLLINFNSENFTALDYFVPKEIDQSILQWLDTSITGKGELTYLMDSGDISYTAEVSALPRNKLLPDSTVIETSFFGDNTFISFSELKAVNKNGSLIFQGNITYDSLLPEGELLISYTINQIELESKLKISKNKKNLEIESKKVSINNLEMFNFISNISFFPKNIDFDSSFSLLDKPEKLNEDKIIVDGNIQYLPDLFLNLSIASYNTPIKLLLNTIFTNNKSYFVDLPKLSMNSEMFFSTNFSQFSFAAPQLSILSDQGDSIKLSVFGNNESIDINDISINWKKNNLEGSIITTIDKSTINTSINLLYENNPYGIILSYYKNTGIFFDGMYGLTGHWYKSGKKSQFSLAVKDFPIPLDDDISLLSINTDGNYMNSRDWEGVINQFSISNIPNMIPDNSFSTSGILSENQILLTSIEYRDSLSILNGSAALNTDFLETNNIEGYFKLESLLGELYDGEIILLENDLSINTTFNNAPLNRFPQIPLFGDVTGELNISGLIPEPDISLTFQLQNGEYNSSPLEIESSIELSSTDIQLKYLRLKFLNQILQKGSGEYNYKSGEFFFGNEVLGSLKDNTLKANMIISGKSDPLISRPGFSELLSNNYSIDLILDNMLVNESVKEQQKYKLYLEDKNLKFRGGPGDSLSGFFTKDGDFTVNATRDIPLRGNAVGNLKDGLIYLQINNMQVDLTILNLIPMGGYFEFTGGTAYGNLNISGPLNDPAITGRFISEKSTGNIAMVQEDIEPFSTEIVFDNRTINIGPEVLEVGNSLVRVGVSLLINNWVPDTYALDIKTLDETYLHIIYNVPAVGLGIDGFAAGSLTIMGNEYGTSINSDLLVDDCIINLGQSSSEPSNSDFSLFTDMKFTTGRKVQFIWPTNTIPILRATAEPGQSISFKMDNTSSTYSINGDVNIKYGGIYYFQKSFRLSEGSIIFNENESKFDPLLDFKAQIKEVDSEGEVINISLIQDKMPVSQFAPRFESDPPLSDVEIFSILGSGIFANIGSEQIDLTSALKFTGDLVTQFAIIQSFENKVKEIFNLDLFSIRTQMIQNILIDRLVDSGGSNQDAYLDSFGRYLDNTTLYLGKYLGDDIFLQALVQISNEEILAADQLNGSNRLFVESTVSLEWQTPLFLLGFSLKPDFLDPIASIQNTSLELSWGYSY
jgi:translocation and assembly module TamB